MVENENTQLTQDYGLTIPLIEDGEKAEFEPVEKPRKAKNPLYDSAIVDSAIDATFTDLRNAYMDLEKTTNDNNELKQQVQKLSGQVQQLQAEAKVHQNDVEEIKNMDKALTKMEKDSNERKAAFEKQVKDANQQAKAAEAKINELNQTIQDQAGKLNSDQTLIDDLNRQVEELSANGGSAEEIQAKEAELEQTKQELTNDVNEVLSHLRSKFNID